MPWHPPPDRSCRRRQRAAPRKAPRRAPSRRTQRGSGYAASSSDLRSGGIACALVVGPADLQIVALLAALEGEFDIGVLGNAAAPVGQEHRLAVILERELLD